METLAQIDQKLKDVKVLSQYTFTDGTSYRLRKRSKICAEI